MQIADAARSVRAAHLRWKGNVAARDAKIAKHVRSGLLTEREAAEAADVTHSYAHRAVKGRTGGTATFKKRPAKRRPPSGG